MWGSRKILKSRCPGRLLRGFGFGFGQGASLLASLCGAARPGRGEPGMDHLPAKRMWEEHISAKTQPHAHMSIAVVYEVQPSRISGARYGWVTTVGEHAPETCGREGRGLLHACVAKRGGRGAAPHLRRAVERLVARARLHAEPAHRVEVGELHRVPTLASRTRPLGRAGRRARPRARRRAQQHVLRLEVAVRDALAVAVRERVEHLAEHLARLRQRQLAACARHTGARRQQCTERGCGCTVCGSGVGVGSGSSP